MATTATLLTKFDTAIEGLLDAIADDSMEEYSIGNRRYRRAEFSSTLDKLMINRDRLLKRQAASSNRVTVAKLGNARRTDR